MKINIIFATALTMSLIACTNHDETVFPSDEKVHIKILADINNISTRASGASWTENDRIGISTIPGTRTDYTNIPYKWNGTKFNADGSTIYFQSDETVAFRAYYPYDVHTGTLTAVTDAEAQKNLPEIDFLFATGATTDKSYPIVAFTDNAAFRHCMRQISITFEEGDDMAFTGMLTSYSLNGLILKGAFNTETGVAQATAGESASNMTIALENVTVTNKKYAAAPVILFPQDVTGGKIELAVAADGNVYKATLTLPDADGDETMDTALLPGYNYKFAVRVNKTGLEIGAAEILPWNEVTGGSTDAVM